MSDLLHRLPLVFVRRYGKFHDLATCGGGDEVLVAVSRQAAARKGTVAVNRDAYLTALARGVKYLYLHNTATGHRLFMSIMDLPSRDNSWRPEGYQVVTLPEWSRHAGFSPSVELDEELLKSAPEELPKHPMHPLAAAHRSVHMPLVAAVTTNTFDRQRDFCVAQGLLRQNEPSLTVKLTTLIEYARRSGTIITIDGVTETISLRPDMSR